MSEVFPKKKITYELNFVNMSLEIILPVIVAVVVGTVVSQIVGVLYRKHKDKGEG